MNDHCPRISQKCQLATYFEGEVHCGANISTYGKYINKKGVLLARKISQKVDCAHEVKIKSATKDIMTSKATKSWR